MKVHRQLSHGGSCVDPPWLSYSIQFQLCRMARFLDYYNISDGWDRLNRPPGPVISEDGDLFMTNVIDLLPNVTSPLTVNWSPTVTSPSLGHNLYDQALSARWFSQKSSFAKLKIQTKW